MALPLVLRDYRRVGAQSGDLSLGVVMGNTQRPSSRGTSQHDGRALRSGEPPSVAGFKFDCDIWEKSQPELKKKNKELARVQERLQLQDLDPGTARELREYVTILEREIGELARAPIKK